MLNKSRLRIKIQIAIIVAIFLFVSFGYFNIASAYGSDSLPPLVSNIVLTVSNPMDTQTGFGWENISCTITDNIDINSVYLIIIYPNDTTYNISMMNQPGSNLYYYNTSYSNIGNYTYFILAKDTNGNSKSSITHEFSMIPNWDINKDGRCTVLDIVLISSYYGETGSPGWIREDIDNNGRIQVFDFILVGKNYDESHEESIYLIHNSKGNTWPASGMYIQAALDNLNGPGEVWLPEGTLDVYNNIYISNPGTKIHGQGYDKTTIVFHNSRLISSQNPKWNNDTRSFSLGLDNIQLDNFKFTGDGNLELVLGNNTNIYNIVAENITMDRPGGFRFVIPSETKYVSGLTVTNCHSYKTHWHGFFINGVSHYCTIENVSFIGCSARYAGWPFPAENRWSVGFHMCDDYVDPVNMTIKNVSVENCVAEYNWESGFHFENTPDKINVTLKSCLAQYNGQKRYYYNESYIYCSGFMGMQKDITLIDCIANYNTYQGYLRCNHPGFPPAVLINCTGTGNWYRLGG